MAKRARKTDEDGKRRPSTLANMRVGGGKIEFAGDTQQQVTSLETIKIDKRLNPANTYKPEYENIASRLTAAGFTLDDLAYGFGVDRNVISKWKREHKPFKVAIKEGKFGQRKRLVAKSFMAASGYTYQYKKTKISYDKAGAVLKTEVTVFDNEQPPNHNLLMWVLGNISRQLGDDEWTTRHAIDVNKKTVVHIDGKEEFDRISKFAGNYFKETPTERVKKRKLIESKTIDET